MNVVGGKLQCRETGGGGVVVTTLVAEYPLPPRLSAVSTPTAWYPPTLGRAGYLANPPTLGPPGYVGRSVQQGRAAADSSSIDS